MGRQLALEGRAVWYGVEITRMRRIWADGRVGWEKIGREVNDVILQGAVKEPRFSYAFAVGVGVLHWAMPSRDHGW
jgi:hypothetical protein